MSETNRIRIGINGFGRTGRGILRTCCEKKRRNPMERIEICAINDPNLSITQMANLIKYDSVHRRFPGEVRVEGKTLIVDGMRIQVFNEENPENIPWRNVNVHYVLESSGLFTTMEQAQRHIKGGAQRVIITAQSPDVPTFVFGVNENKYRPDMKIISSANEELTAFAPLARLIHERVGIEDISLTSILPLSQIQNTLDGPTLTPRKSHTREGRSAHNLVPRKLELHKEFGQLFPDLKDVITSTSFRTPIQCVGALDVYMRLKREIRLDDVERMIQEAKEKKYEWVFNYTRDEVVSSDFISDPHSFTLDRLASTEYLNKKKIKLVLWFDNEYGYSHRVLDLVEMTSRQ